MNALRILLVPRNRCITNTHLRGHTKGLVFRDRLLDRPSSKYLLRHPNRFR